MDEILDKKLQEIQGKLASTRDTNKTILRIANDLVTAENRTCDCECETALKETTTGINRIKDGIETLQKNGKESDKRQAVIQSQIRELENRMRAMKDEILSVQTGESRAVTNENLEQDQATQGGDDDNDDDNDDDDDKEERGGEDIVNVKVSREIQHDPDGPARGESASIHKLSPPKSNQKLTSRIDQNTPLKRTEFRPNFVSSSSGQARPSGTLPSRYRSAKVQVVRQTKKTFMLLGEPGWKNIAQQTLDREREQAPPSGVSTTLCVDISESMAKGTAWTEATQFIYEFIDGLEEMRTKHMGAGLQEEYVSLVTFGHATDLQIVHAKQYGAVRNSIETMKLGGPTPLNGGLFMALAAAMSAQRAGLKLDFLESVGVHPRIIIITDGHVTDVSLTGGPDVSDKSDVEKTKHDLMKEVDEISKRGIDIWCVPVGDADKDMLNLMVGVAEGTMMDFHQGRRAARRQYLSSSLRRGGVASIGLPGLAPDFISSPEPPTGEQWSQEDKEDMISIQKSHHKHILRSFTRRERTNDEDQYKESTNDSLPAIGSRVRRGPDWKWRDQDGHGPGTIIGHFASDKELWVEWDTNGDRNVYRYDGHHYDVLLVDEERSLKPWQKIAVGCAVRPGKDGLSSGLKTWDKGVVIKLIYGASRVENKALVRWGNGKRGNYSYGEDGKHEIELWSESGSTLTGIHNKNAAGTSSSSQSGSGMNFARHKNKNT